MPVGEQEREVTSKQTKKLPCLMGGLQEYCPTKKETITVKEKAHEQQQLPRQRWASSKIRLFTHLACCCSKFI